MGGNGEEVKRAPRVEVQLVSSTGDIVAVQVVAGEEPLEPGALVYLERRDERRSLSLGTSDVMWSQWWVLGILTEGRRTKREPPRWKGTMTYNNLSKALRAYRHFAALVRSSRTVFWGPEMASTASNDQLTRAADPDLAKEPPPMTSHHVQDAIDLLKEFEGALGRGERLSEGPMSASAGEEVDKDLEAIVKGD